MDDSLFGLCHAVDYMGDPACRSRSLRLELPSAAQRMEACSHLCASEKEEAVARNGNISGHSVHIGEQLESRRRSLSGRCVRCDLQRASSTVPLLLHIESARCAITMIPNADRSFPMEVSRPVGSNLAIPLRSKGEAASEIRRPTSGKRVPRQ